MHPSHIFLQNINRNCTPQKVDDIYQETFLGYFCIFLHFPPFLHIPPFSFIVRNSALCLDHRELKGAMLLPRNKVVIVC